MSFESPTPGLRASDADREATVTRLHRAAMEGRLDADELEERLSAAYGAKLCSELEHLTADITPPAPPSPARFAAPVFVGPVRRTNSFAIAALVTAVLWMWWIGSVLAVIFGHVALRQIAASGGRQSGRGFAVAGLVIGYLGILVAAVALISAAW